MPMLNGEKIREFRDSIGLTQAEFVEYLAKRAPKSEDKSLIDWIERRAHEGNPDPLSAGWVSRIENNKVNVRPITARFIATGMGLEVNDILNISSEGRNEDTPKASTGYHAVPAVLTSDILYQGPDRMASIELEEITAHRFSDDAVTVLGYGTLEQYQLITLMKKWAGGGLSELLDWGGTNSSNALFVYKPGLGFLVGPKGEPFMLISGSGSRVRLEFITGRSEELVVAE